MLYNVWGLDVAAIAAMSKECHLIVKRLSFPKPFAFCEKKDVIPNAREARACPELVEGNPLCDSPSQSTGFDQDACPHTLPESPRCNRITIALTSMADTRGNERTLIFFSRMFARAFSVPLCLS
ncbi:MAG TPA: hypothetical protein VND65_22390 [Candidatus Binatia bacterium]|nr:hypothetical protein [Candidatus Binatia bacterium]